MHEEREWDDCQVPPLIIALRGSPVIYNEALTTFQSQNFYRISAANEASHKTMSLSSLHISSHFVSFSSVLDHIID